MASGKADKTSPGSPAELHCTTAGGELCPMSALKHVPAPNRTGLGRLRAFVCLPRLHATKSVAVLDAIASVSRRGGSNVDRGKSWINKHKKRPHPRPEVAPVEGRVLSTYFYYEYP